MLRSPKRDPVQFWFLKTQEPQVKFRVGFGPDPALTEIGFRRYFLTNVLKYLYTYLHEF